MKKGIHPDYKELKIKIGEEEFFTSSTLYSSELLMDVDYRKHPAWNKESRSFLNQSNQNVHAFNKKFGGLSFGV